MNSCVYLLKLNESVVYVGQTLDIDTRLYQHKQNKKIDFDDVELIPTEYKNLNNIEAENIMLYMPVHNLRLPPNSEFESLNQFIELLKPIVKDKCKQIGKVKYLSRHDVDNYLKALKDANI